MQHPTPEVSVIIPVFHAHATLPKAIASIGAPEIPLEIVISVDDGLDYAFARDLDERVVIVDAGCVQSGPGATRNRAIAAAKGTYLAYLDDDDTWSADYLATLLPLAKQHGCAFAQTRILDHVGQDLLTVPLSVQSHLTLADIALWGASFHPVHAAQLHQTFIGDCFWQIPAQDVMHTVEVLLACGGTAPLSQQVNYQLQLRDRSVTQADDFSARVAQAYAAYEQALAQTAAAGIFQQRAALNTRYMHEALPKETFYRFIARTHQN